MDKKSATINQHILCSHEHNILLRIIYERTIYVLVAILDCRFAYLTIFRDYIRSTGRYISLCDKNYTNNVGGEFICHQTFTLGSFFPLFYEVYKRYLS